MTTPSGLGSPLVCVPFGTGQNLGTVYVTVGMLSKNSHVRHGSSQIRQGKKEWNQASDSSEGTEGEVGASEFSPLRGLGTILPLGRSRRGYGLRIHK